MEETKELWTRFRAGDEKTLKVIYDTYIDTLYHYALGYTKDKEMIGDCIHDLFFAMYSKRTIMEEPRNLKFYLLISLKNRLLNALNDQSRYEKLEAEKISFQWINSAETEFIQKEEDLLNKKKIEEFFSLLSDRQREVLYYRFIQELSVAEISEIMGLTPQSTSNLIQKAIQKLRSKYTMLMIIYLLQYVK